MRSFANGCTALTGVEAVSNSVPMFRQPAANTARRSLTLIVSILVVLLAGVATLAWGYGIGATHPGQTGYQSVLSQLVAAVEGRGVFYQLTMMSVFAVLLLSANTSFADFPRLCRLLALDGYLPGVFSHRGRRLVYTPGILLLSVLSGALLVGFQGITDRLIPLFAIGAFLAFTLSQTGMVAHWLKLRGAPGARRSLVANAAGALATGITVVVLAVSKFSEGAWIAVVLVPTLVLIFFGVHGAIGADRGPRGWRQRRSAIAPDGGPTVSTPCPRAADCSCSAVGSGAAGAPATD